MSDVLIMHRNRCVSFTPRGGGQRDRRRTLRSPSPISPTPLNLFPGRSLRRDIRLPRVWGNLGIRCPVRTFRPHFDFLFGCFVFGLGMFAFQLVLFGLFRTFFIIGWKKDAVCLALMCVFWITADRDNCHNFVGCKSISPIRLGRTILYKAFVRFRILNNWFSIPFSTKTIDPTAVSANPTKRHGKNST